MPEDLSIRPLRCGHCGNELPVMGQLVTFQCPSCLRYWVLGAEALEPVTVHRAIAPEDGPAAGDGRVWLPFWIAEVDGPALKRRIDETAGAERLPSPTEIRNVMERLESVGMLRIFIPAFKSLNTYAYLKVGRLLTRAQPAFSIERSDGAGRPVLCALRAEEAAALMDFIFFATLAEPLQSNSDFLERIHLEPAEPLRLVELPFRPRGASLVSIIGGFWISGRLVEWNGALVQ